MRVTNLFLAALVFAAIDQGCSCGGSRSVREGGATDGPAENGRMDAGMDGADAMEAMAGTDATDASDATSASDATTATDGADANPDASACAGSVDGTPCASGLCVRGACTAPATASTTIDLSTTAVTAGRTCAEAPEYSVMSLSSDEAVLSAAPDCLAIGDEVLLINLQGAPGAVANVGNWELLTISAISGTDVHFAPAKTKSYGAAAGSDSGIGTGATDQKVALVRVPQFGALTVDVEATLTSAAWNGATGGVVVLRAASLTLNGAISAAGLGYRGGRWSRDTEACSANVATEAGESIDGPGAAGTANNIGGAGGVSAASGISFISSSPLNAGAGHAQPGGTGSNGNGRTVGDPGVMYGVNDASRLTMGSGQSGNLTCENGFPGPALVTIDEPLAGGIVLLLTQSLQIGSTGTVTSGAKTSSRDVSASGGYVFIRGGTLTLGSGAVTAIGGTGTPSSDAVNAGASVKAGDGYVVVQGSTVTGTTTPAANRL